MNNLSLLLFFTLILSVTSKVQANFVTPGTQEFVFNLSVPKNTCDILITGTSQNVVDFKNITLSKFKSDSDVPQGKVKLPFEVVLNNCKTKNFENSYITLSGNEANDGYLDSPLNKTFAVRISEKDNAQQSDTDFFDSNNNKIWVNSVSTPMSESGKKTYYAYIMCKGNANGCADDSNVGKFQSTLTLTFISD